jgi:hypothetical protein
MSHKFLIAAYVLVFVFQFGYALRVAAGLAKTR